MITDILIIRTNKIILKLRCCLLITNSYNRSPWPSNLDQTGNFFIFSLFCGHVLLQYTIKVKCIPDFNKWDILLINQSAGIGEMLFSELTSNVAKLAPNCT